MSLHLCLFPSSAGFRQCPYPPLHLGLKNTPAVFSICWGQDLPEQESRGGPKKEAARKEETCPADTRASRQPEGGLRACAFPWGG